MDSAAGPLASATAWERFFMECDKSGRILWMNQRTRARLGIIDSLLDALPEYDLAAIRSLLTGSQSGSPQRVLSSVLRPDRTGTIPVHFVRLLALENRVVLSAELRARASDVVPAQDAILRSLLELQTNAVRNYFRLRNTLEALEAQTRASSRSVGLILAEAIEMERTRIARELHSGVGQTLAGIKVNLELLEARTPDASEGFMNATRRIHWLADQALSEIRAISQHLHRPEWTQLGLEQALQILWQTTGIPDKFHAKLEIHLVEPGLPDALRSTFYRAAQEGLANVLRHSGASQVKLTLEERMGRVNFVLEDNGTGFDAQAQVRGWPGSSTRGIGLRAMREEVLALSGDFRVTSGPEGTRMEISIPIAENR